MILNISLQYLFIPCCKKKNLIRVTHLSVVCLWVSPSLLLINMKKDESKCPVVWSAICSFQTYGIRESSPTAWTSIVYIINIHWEAGKECWILLLRSNYSQCENETHYKSRLKGYKESEWLIPMSISSRRIFIAVCIFISTCIKELMGKITLLERFIIVLAGRLNIIMKSKGTAWCWFAHAHSLKEELKSDYRFTNSSQEPSLLFCPAFNHM